MTGPAWSDDEFAVRTGPVRVRLSGRDGAGRRTLAAALARRGLVVDGADPGPPAAPGHRGADTHLYCFAGGLRAADRAALDRLAAGPRPVLAVRCQADLAGSWRRADELAARIAADLAAGGVAVPVLGVMALLDAALADPATAATRFAGLRAVACGGLPLDGDVPALTELLGAHRDLLPAFGRYGLGCAVGALRQRPELTPAELAARLAELSGVDAVAAASVPPPDRLAAIRAAESDRHLHRLLIAAPDRRDRAEAALLRRASGAW